MLFLSLRNQCGLCSIPGKCYKANCTSRVSFIELCIWVTWLLFTASGSNFGPWNAYKYCCRHLSWRLTEGREGGDGGWLVWHASCRRRTLLRLKVTFLPCAHNMSSKRLKLTVSRSHVTVSAQNRPKLGRLRMCRSLLEYSEHRRVECYLIGEYLC
jgi:hypothetical protein